jgi:hypothetical protein
LRRSKTKSSKTSVNRLAVVGTAIVSALVILISLLPIQVGISSGFTSIQEAKASGHFYILDPWLSGWSYRKQVTVTNASADYQTEILVGESSGASGYDVHCNGHVKSDFSDLRFTGSDGVTLLSYWIESITGTSPNQLATVWVKNDAIPSTTCYMYYGNSQATSASSVNSTFIRIIDGVKASWHFDEGSGNTAYDTSGNGNNGTLQNGPTWVDGKFGEALSFDGVDDYVDCGNNQSLNITEAITAEALVYQESLSSGQAGIVEKSITSGYTGWALIQSSSFYTAFIADTSGTLIGLSTSAVTGQWVHLAVVKDSSKMYLYKNGVLANSKNFTTAIKSNTQTVKIGKYAYWSANNMFKGLIDEVRIYNRALISDEIIDLYCNYGYTTLNYPGVVLVRKYTSPEPIWGNWESEESAPVAPTVTTQAATSITSTSCLANGNITDTGGENCHTRGFCYMEGASGDPTTANSKVYDNGGGNYGAGTYSKTISGLSPGTSYRVRAYAINSAGTGYGETVTVLTKPAAPTNVAATDGTYTDKVRITWTKSTGATGYKVYEGSNLLDTLGDVDQYDDTTAPAPTITPGTASASDGSSTAHVTLSVSGESANNGAPRTYKVKAFNDSGDSDDSSTDTGYRGVGSLAYQWYRSSGDSDGDYSLLSGATSDPYNDATAPAPTVTAGSASASDGASTEYVILSVSGESGNNGAGRYYKCYLSAAGASSQYSTADRGYRGTTTLTYQWYRSAADSDENYSILSGATTNPYNDTEGVYSPDGRYYKCLVSMTDAVSRNSTPDRGYKLTYPTVTSTNATSITNVRAVLHGDITDTGGKNAVLRGFEWGLESGNYTWSWNETDSFPEGPFQHEVTDLASCTQYFWRAFATNDVGQGNSTEQSFWTLCTPSAPTNFTITQSSPSSANITWNKGIGAEYTVIVGSDNKYPANINDGYLVYNGTGTTCIVEDLSLWSTTYQFKAWSWNSYGYSTDYAEGSIGGNMIALAIIGLVSLVLMVFGFLYKPASIPLLILAGICWTTTGILVYTNSAFGSLSIPVLTIAVAIAFTCFVWLFAAVMRLRRARLSREEQDYADYEEKVRNITRR